MRSRILIGTSAWVLGAVAATTGSLYAANQLARGLLEQNVAQVTIAKVNAELAAENRDGAAATSPSPGPASSSSAKAKSPKARPSATGPSTTNPGQLLTASDGTVMAVCQPGGAYLVYWSPQQGFEAEHVYRGPLQVASVTFVNTSGSGEIVKVSCSGTTPVANVSPVGWHDD